MSTSTDVMPTGMDPTVWAGMEAAKTQQNQMFIDSMQMNLQNSELQTWGNLGEEIAKAKPQV